MMTIKSANVNNLCMKLKKVVLAFIYHKDQILLQLRDENKKIVYPGQWGLISGSLNFDENPYDAVRREIKEEISITNIKNIVFVDTSLISKKNENIFYYVFRIYLKNPRKIKLNEGIEYSFFSKTEYLRGFKFSRKLRKNCFIVNHPVVKKFYFRTQRI